MNQSTHRGLVVCENAVDERQVSGSLRDFDDRLRLAQEVDAEYGCFVYRVVRVWSNDHDAAVICEWRDEQGMPLPLSHRLVDKVKTLSMNSRAPQVDVVAHNDALVAAQQREADELFEELARDAARRSGRVNAFHRSPGLARTRARLRDKGYDA
jgi:hypothetical protein